jgi:hypothetical protein
LGLVWNTRDSRHPFVRALAEIMGPSPAELLVDADEVQRVPGFGPFERRRWERVRTMTADALMAMVTSRSHYLVAPREVQHRIRCDVRSLLANHPHTAGGVEFDYPLHTTCYRADALR